MPIDRRVAAVRQLRHGDTRAAGRPMQGPTMISTKSARKVPLDVEDSARALALAGRSELRLMQPGVGTAARQQFRVAALLDDAAVLHHDD